MPDYLGDDMRKTKKGEDPEKEEKEIKSESIVFVPFQSEKHY